MKRVPLLSLLALAACSDSSAPNLLPSSAESAVSLGDTGSRFVTVAPGIALEYVDYGGRGTPLVLLAGSGNTAHVFATFAWRFTDRHHVIAITRRGFGASSKPATGYDTRTLSEDIRTVLDSLKLARVNLMGHSIAGDEMTRFAGDHPDRVQKLVYLDAAYDRVALGSILAQFPFPPPPPPTTKELASPRGFARYVQRVRGVVIPDAEIAASFRFAPDGSFLDEVASPETYAALLGGEESPDYSRVSAPALGVYAVARNAGDIIPWLTPASPDWPLAQAVFDLVFAPFYARERARFDRGVADSRVLELQGANHYVFLSDADRVAAAVRAFLR